MTLTRSQLVEQRLYNQFTEAERLQELIAVLREYVEEIDDIIEDIALRRFKDTAEGVWLDWVAEIIGIFSRPAEEYGNEELFTYRSLSDPILYSTLQGFGTVGGSTGGRYRSLKGNPIPDTLINDADFLADINAKVAANFADSSLPGIWDYIYKGFGIKTDVVSTETGQVKITLRPTEPLLSPFDRRILIDHAPVLTGCIIYIENWME